MRMIALAAVLLAGCTANSQGPSAAEQRQAQKLAEELAGMVPGEAQRCINTTNVSRIEGHGDTILFVQGRDKLYRTEAPGCGNLAQGDILVTEPIHSGQYCRGDQARTVSTVGRVQTGFCAFGDFVPYERIER